MRCEQCGSESGREQSGVSKKNGKPWRGWRCDDCDGMTWLASDGGAKGGSDGVVRGNAQGGGGVVANGELLVVLRGIEHQLRRLADAKCGVEVPAGGGEVPF